MPSAVAASAAKPVTVATVSALIVPVVCPERVAMAVAAMDVSESVTF